MDTAKVQELPYDIVLDLQQDIMRISVRGHWTLATQTSFERDVDQAKLRYRSSGRSLNRLRVLVDARAHGVQSRNVADRISAYSNELIALVAKTAVLVESKLHKLQAQRISDHARHLVFAEEDDALQWLNESD